MASIEELIKLNIHGDLGDLLVKRFRGERGMTYARKDSEFIIGFATEAECPGVAQVIEAVEEHYRKQGYDVELNPCRVDALEGCVFLRDKSEGYVHISITTKYPLSPTSAHRNLRVTTETSN